jgi:glycosyltransferase involved in cell wall biosynthesis
MIGRVDYGHKNNLAALDATDILRNMGKAVELVVVGDGPDLDHFKSTTVARGLDGIVTFLGWRDDPWKSVPSDAIVLIPSWYESLNLVAREAMSHGIRLAVSPLPVFHEWIPEQLIADDFSADAFAKAIIHVHGMRSSEMRQLYGKALRKFSDVNFVESFIAYSDER